MRRALLVLALAGCGRPEAGSPSIPLQLTLDRATASSLSQLQFTLITNAGLYDCGTLPSGCVRNEVKDADILRLTDDSGTTHLSALFDLSADPSGQTFQIKGIPATSGTVKLIVEGVTRSGNQLGASFCKDIPGGIQQGTNPAQAITLPRLDPPVDCDPRF